MLPLTTEQLLGVFEQDNETVWSMPAIPFDCLKLAVAKPCSMLV